MDYFIQRSNLDKFVRMQASSILASPIAAVKGLGPKRAIIIEKELGIHTVYELLFFIPNRYIDKRALTPISTISLENSIVQTQGVLQNIKLVKQAKGYRLSAELVDNHHHLELVWFKGYQYIEKQLKEGQSYKVYGKVSRFQDRFSIAHPEMSQISIQSEQDFKGHIEPLYPISDKLQKVGITQRLIRSILQPIVKSIDFELHETLPAYIVREQMLIDKTSALIHLHAPTEMQETQRALDRLKFEELFYMQLGLLYRKIKQKTAIKGQRFEAVGTPFLAYYESHLPFELTEAQKRVLREIRNDMGSGLQMNRLLQGDVGSGKTMVALMACLIAIGNGSQACIVAPTEILAQQHYHDIASKLASLNSSVKLLTGSIPKKERSVLHEELRSGELQILIGTHAVFEDNVIFKNLGLAIIDEQHRFGVAQRSKLWKKAEVPPHILVMTATPIPRTLAMSTYGDLDISIIDELPPGRSPIITSHRTDRSRLKVFAFIREQIKLGRQVYIVYPLIQESAALDYKDLMDGYESLCREFPSPEYALSILHGQMSAEAKQYEMNQFEKGTTQIMVATTVIEVGVNVPNATVMIIESAERFGLAQLHQLRGRVGRGTHQSYCILMTKDNLLEDAKTRIESMVKYSSGFDLSEIDLKLRGPGDLMGTQQSGSLQLKFADLVDDVALMGATRGLVQGLLEKDSTLELQEHQCIRSTLQMLLRGKLLWSYIS
jgi:ATP-dependent DNA helicase RecG